jgi:hypothetical protein
MYPKLVLNRMKIMWDLLRTRRSTRRKAKKKGLNLTFKQKKQDKITWFENKNIKIKNKNTRCARPTWKQIFIMLTYVNMNMKKTWQGYVAILCLRLMLNILKEMKGPIFI